MISRLKEAYEQNKFYFFAVGGLVMAAGAALYLRSHSRHSTQHISEEKEKQLETPISIEGDLGEERKHHDVAQQAFGFGKDTGSYDKGRVRYPGHVVKFLVERLNLPREGEVRIADLGAGSGKFTKLLLNETDENVKIIASEPVESFGIVMRTKFIDEIESGRLDIVHARTEDLPFDDSSLDAITCAAAFHWFANKEALAEISRVLKPGGVLALIWQHLERDTNIEWIKEFDGYMRQFKRDHGGSREKKWKSIFTEDCQFPNLEGEEWRNSAVQRGTIDTITARAVSSSRVASKTEEEKKKILEDIRELVYKCVPEARDDPGYVFEIPHWAEVYWASNEK